MLLVMCCVKPSADLLAPKSTIRMAVIYKIIIKASNNLSFSPRTHHAIPTVIGGPKLAITLMIVKGMYFELAVLIMFDQELCSARKVNALSC